MDQDELYYRKRFLTFIDHFYSNRLVLGATALAVFALIISLFVYAVFSWIDAAQFGMSSRDQILHIAVPIFVAIALIPFSAQQMIAALNVV